MAVNNKLDGHPLPCGRLVEDVFDDLDHGRSDAHGRTCVHCGTARRSLAALLEATRSLVDDPAEPPATLLDRIMQAVRVEARRGDAIPLRTGEDDAPELGPVDVSEQAVAAVVRYAADTVDGVRARSCRVGSDPADPTALTVEMTVSLRYGAGSAEDLVGAVRARVGDAVRGQVGVRASVVDVQVVDVWSEDAEAGEERS